MKRLILILSILLVGLSTNAQRYNIVGQDICWNTGSVDSSLTRYFLVSTQTNQVKILTYLNSSGATVTPSGGTFAQGHCGCCGGSSSTSTSSPARSGLTNDMDTLKLGGVAQENTSLGGNGTFGLDMTNWKYLNFSASDSFKIITPGLISAAVEKGGLLQLNSSTGRVEFTPYGFPTSDGTNGQFQAYDSTGDSLKWTSPYVTAVETDTSYRFSVNGSSVSSISRKEIIVNNTDDLSALFLADSMRVLSLGDDGKGEAVYYTYSSIPADYPVQSVDNRFVFQDAGSIYIVYQPDQFGRYNAKNLGMVGDWNHTTRTGIDNKAIFVDIVEKIDTNATLFIPKGSYGFSTVTNLNFSPKNFNVVGESMETTKLYFKDGGTIISLTDASNVSFRDISFQGYNSDGPVTPFDVFRTFNIDTFLLENIRVDSLNLILTDHGPASTSTYSSSSSGLMFNNVNIYNPTNGMVFKYSEDIQIIGGYIYNSSGDGIKFNKYTFNWVISGMTIEDSGDDLIDTYGGGFNGIIEKCNLKRGEVEIKAHAKANVADNIKILKNNFTNASVKSDEGSYSDLNGNLVFDLASDGTITHGLNVPSTDNSYLDIKAYQDGTFTEVTFTESSITENAFDFSLTSGSYPVTVIVNTAASGVSTHPSRYRVYQAVDSGTTTLTLDPSVSAVFRELNFGEPKIVTFDTTDYAVVTSNDTVLYSYSTWGDSLTLTWPTALPEGRLIALQTGMDGVSGLVIEGNTFKDGFIFSGNGAYEAVIRNNSAHYTTNTQALQAPYALGNFTFEDNYIEYNKGVNTNDKVPLDLSQTASVIEGAHPPGNYNIRNNTIVNSSRSIDVLTSAWNNILFDIQKNTTINPDDNVSNQGYGGVSGTELIDTLRVVGTSLINQRENSVSKGGSSYRDRTPLITTLATLVASKGFSRNADNTLYYSQLATDPTDQNDFIQINTQFQGILDGNDNTGFKHYHELRTTGGSTNRNYKFFSVTGGFNTSQSLDLRGIYYGVYNSVVSSSQDVSVARLYGHLNRYGAASGTGSIDTLIGFAAHLYNGSGHGLVKSIAYDIDDLTATPPDSTIGYRIPDLNNGTYTRALLQSGVNDTSEFSGPVLIKGDLIVEGEIKGTTPTATSGTTLLITHNLGSFPSAINITPAGDIGNWYLSGINTTTMTLNYETVTPSSVTIYWQVE